MATDQSRVDRAAAWYLIFICVSTIFRCFETGIVASMMPEISENLGLSYQQEGVVSSAPDWGLIPSSILAGWVFKYVRAYYALMVAYAVIGGLCIATWAHGSLGFLIAARSVGGFCWGLAAVHYPAWINCHGSEKRRTMLMALPPTMLMVGTVSGYFLGGAAKESKHTTWTMLYGLEGILMFACTFLCFFFAPDLVSDVDRKIEQAEATPSAGEQRLAGSEQDLEAKSPSKVPQAPVAEQNERTPLRERFRPRSISVLMAPQVYKLATNRLFIFTSCSAACVSAASSVLLYFIVQVGEAALPWEKKDFLLVSGAVMIFSTVGGLVAGSLVVSALGGYKNYVRSLGFATVCAALAVFFQFGLLPCLMRKGLLQWLFTLGFFMYVFFGAAPTAPWTGVAISLVPGASHYASGFMFAVLHIAKLVAPLVAGAIMERIGLLMGYFWTGVGIASLMLVLSLFGLREAVYHQPEASKHA